jgi:DNA-binding transcriptional MerR regulator
MDGRVRVMDKVPEQGTLFADPTDPTDPLASSELQVLGYRGPTACSAAGITYRQLDYWARTGLVVPTVRSATGSGSQRLYSFKDILVLKVVKRLLDAGVSLQNIRIAVEALRARGIDDLAEVTLLSDGTSVYECTSSEEVVDLLRAGQGVFGIAVSGALRELRGSRASAPTAPSRALRSPRLRRRTSWPAGGNGARPPPDSLPDDRRVTRVGAGLLVPSKPADEAVRES